MINPSGNKLEKLLFGIFDGAIEGVDRYNHNGSLWLIFTDEMRWVVEYTKGQTLWYNYYFFKQEMEMVGLDCVEDKDLIQKWFESRFLGIPKVEEAHHVDVMKFFDKKMGNTIENGVKETRLLGRFFIVSVEDTIQNGVRHTDYFNYSNDLVVEDTIQNGVKETTPSGYLGSIKIKGKIVHQIESPKQNNEVEDTIQNGVKNTYSDKIPHEYDWSDQFTEGIEDTIQNGVKETKEFRVPTIDLVEDIIQNGVKDTQCDERSYPEWVEDIIQNGVKDIRVVTFLNQMFIEETIQNGVKHCEDGDRLDGDYRFEDIIQNGEKK